MSTALIFTCTGEPYRRLFLQPMLAQVKKFFPADVLLFTDTHEIQGVARQVFQPHQGWPDVTLLRHHAIMSQDAWLARYDNIFLLDIDMEICAPVSEDIFTDGITATTHPDYPTGPGTPEQRACSAACLSTDDIRQYFCGGVLGGSSSEFLTMSDTLRRRIDIDREHGVLAVYHDESHLNRYLYENPPAKILSTDYCCKWWKRTATTVISDVNKDSQGLHR